MRGGDRKTLIWPIDYGKPEFHLDHFGINVLFFTSGTHKIRQKIRRATEATIKEKKLLVFAKMVFYRQRRLLYGIPNQRHLESKGEQR